MYPFFIKENIISSDFVKLIPNYFSKMLMRGILVLL